MSTRGESTKAGKHLGKHDGKISPSKIIKQILHPRHSAESSSSSTILDSKKRHVVDCDDTSARDNKRVRGGVHLSKQDVIVIDDAGEQTSEYTQGTSSGLHKKAKMCQTDKEPAYSKVLDFFRLKPTKVGYAILDTSFQYMLLMKVWFYIARTIGIKSSIFRSKTSSRRKSDGLEESLRVRLFVNRHT